MDPLKQSQHSNRVITQLQTTHSSAKLELYLTYEIVMFDGASPKKANFHPKPISLIETLIDFVKF